jgi:hypothetical protein
MASAAVQYGRMIRPFPVRRLSDLTYHVMADGNAIWQRVTRMMIENTSDPTTWARDLQSLIGELYSLQDRCGELIPQLMAMQDGADRDYEVAVRAMESILRGLQVAGEPPGPGDDVEAAEAVSVA